MAIKDGDKLPQTTVTSSAHVLPIPADGESIGLNTTDKLGFHGATAVVQRTNAAQAAVVTTTATQTSPWGFASQAQANAIVSLVNELRAALVEKGLIKGS